MTEATMTEATMTEATMTEATKTIPRFHWLINQEQTRAAPGHKPTGAAGILIRCPECEMQSKTTAAEVPDGQGLLDFTCRSGMDMCRWQGMVQLAGWKRYQERQP